MMFESSEQSSGKSFQSSDAVSNPAFEISDEIIDKLLDKLSSDDEFRAVFLRSPRIALAYLGHEAATNAGPSDEGVWGCAKCKQLTSKEAILNARTILKVQLLTTLAVHKVINLDASYVTAS